MTYSERKKLADAAVAWLDALRRRGSDVPDSPVNLMGALDALGALRQPDWNKIGCHYEYKDQA
jgi:hypothetical protein